MNTDWGFFPRMFGLLALSFLILLALGVGCVHQVYGQCAAGSCAPPAAAAAQFERSWRTRADDPDRLYLFRDKIQLGAYDLVGGYYRAYDDLTGRWGPPSPPPEPPPPRPQQNFGVDASKLSGQEKYTVHDASGTHEVSKTYAHHRMAKKLEDDTHKLRVTVIGPDADRKRVVYDLVAKMPDLPSWAIVRSYAPDNFAVAGNFVTTGKPTVYCQAPTGQVLHRQDDYAGGPDELVGALRKAKGYDDKKDPDLRKMVPWLQNLDLAKLWPYAAAIAGGLLAGWVFENRKAVR